MAEEMERSFDAMERLVADVKELQVEGPSTSGQTSISGLRQKETEVTNSVVDKPEMSLRDKIRQNLRAYVRGEPEVELLTKTSLFQEFELQAKECLRKNYIQKNNEIAEIMRFTATTFLGMDPEFLEMPLCDLLRDADFPDTVEDLFEKVDRGEIWNRDLELEEEAIKMEDAEVNRQIKVAKKKLPKEATDEEWETDDENPDIEVNSNAETEPDLFNSDNDSETEKYQKSPDLFATPRSSGAVAPRPQKVGRPKSKTNNMIGPLVGLRFPASQPSSVVEGLPPPAPPKVFQFQGKTLNKEPRTLRPGEVLYSATGSPVVPTDEQGNLIPAHTPVRRTGRPVCLRVENPDGTSLEVELVRRGRLSNMEEAQNFREFITDVRGLITTRSAMNAKVMTARVPNSSTRKKKPVWKH